MTTVQQTGSIDLGANNTAAKTATNYITEISQTGIKMSEVGLTELDRLEIKPSGFELFRTSESIAKFGMKTRLGNELYSHQELSPQGMRLFQGDNDIFAIEPYGDLNVKFVSTITDPVGLPQAAHTNGFWTAGVQRRYENEAEKQRLIAYFSALVASPSDYQFRAFDITSGTPVALPWYQELVDAGGNPSTSLYMSNLTYIAGNNSSGYVSLTLTVNNNTDNDALIVIGNGLDVRPVRTRIGKKYVEGATDNESHMELDYHSMQMVDKEGRAYIHLSDLRNQNGIAEVTETSTASGDGLDFYVSLHIYNNAASSIVRVVLIEGDTETELAYETDYTLLISSITQNAAGIRLTQSPTVENGVTCVITYISDAWNLKAFTFGMRKAGNVGGLSFAEGNNVLASGLNSHAEGYGTEAIGASSHAEGSSTKANSLYAHSEGGYTEANGWAAHSEGGWTKANCDYAHTEGERTEASSAEYSGYEANCGEYGEIFLDGMETGGSHAEGYYSKALGSTSHSEGLSTRAEGVASHAAGSGTKALGAVSTATGIETIASGRAQTVIGRCNVEDTNNEYAMIIGNGEYTDQRSNALAVNWQGTIVNPGPTMNDAISSTPSGLQIRDPANMPLSQGTAVSSNTYGDMVAVSDMSGDQRTNRAQVRYVSFADGRQGVQLETSRRKADGTMVYNGVQLFLAADGTRSIALSEAAPWRKALGANSSGAWPLGCGGTGATDAAGARTNLGLKALAQKASVSFSTTNASKTSSKGSVEGGSSIALSTALTSPGTGYAPTGVFSVNSNHNSVCVVNMFDGDTIKLKNIGSSKLTDLTATLSFKYGKVTVS